MNELTTKQILDFINLPTTYDNLFGPLYAFGLLLLFLAPVIILIIEEIENKIMNSVVLLGYCISIIVCLLSIAIISHNNDYLNSNENPDVIKMEKIIASHEPKNNYYIIDSEKSKYENLRLFLCYKKIKELEAIGQEDKCKEIISNYEQTISNEIDYYDNKHDKYNDKLTKTKLIQEKLNQLKSSN